MYYRSIAQLEYLPAMYAYMRSYMLMNENSVAVLAQKLAI